MANAMNKPTKAIEATRMKAWKGRSQNRCMKNMLTSVAFTTAMTMATTMFRSGRPNFAKSTFAAITVTTVSTSRARQVATRYFTGTRCPTP